MPAAPAFDLPPLVGRYELHGEIASGGMATVHFGRLQGAAGFARSVAIKRLHPQFAKDPDFVAMLVDEARLAARIAHPNVVPTLDVVSLENELLLVMEYVRGASLSRLLRLLEQRGVRAPPRIAASIIAGTLRGLHAAHEAKSESGEPLHIVHRDVSPHNILVGTDGVARVLDFGVAKARGRWQSTHQGQLKGKIAYMAPEQVTTGNVTRQTDLYAAAVVLWETLTGRRLFRSENQAEALSLVLKAEVPPPSQLVEGLPRGFDSVVLTGLERDPAKRFATARVMAAAVEAVIGAAPYSEVGEWVESVATDELRERADRVQEIERSLPTSPSKTIARRAAEPTVVEVETAAAPRARVTASVGSNLAIATTGPPSPLEPRPMGVRAIAIALCAVLGAAGMTFFALRASQETPHESRVEVARHPSASSSAVVPPKTTAAPTSAWIPLPSASATSVPALNMNDVPAAAPTAPPPRPRGSDGTTRKQNTPVAPTSQGCRPPYTVDGKGHLHFKAECIE